MGTLFARVTPTGGIEPPFSAQVTPNDLLTIYFIFQSLASFLVVCIYGICDCNYYFCDYRCGNTAPKFRNIHLLHPLLSATSGSRHGHAVVIPFLHCTAAFSRLTSSGASRRSFTAMAIFIVSCRIAMRGPSGT